MHDKCSSGYAYRLLNTLSGYHTKSISISWADQIAGNLAGRLNALIRNIEDEEVQASVMSEMCIDQEKTILERKNFMAFFRKSLPQIHEELYDEFKELISDADFNLYMRRAIAKYEGYEWQ